MTDINKPKYGDPAEPFLANTKMWSELLDMLNEWKQGKLNNPKQMKAMTTTPMGEAVGASIPSGLLRRLTLPDDPTTMLSEETLLLFERKPVFPLADVVWQTNIHKTVFLQRPIIEGGQSTVGGARFVTAEVTGDGPYAMIDPADTEKLKASTSGIFKIVQKYANGTALLDTQASQPLWRFETTATFAGCTNPEGTVSAKLMGLDGTLFASSINLTVFGTIFGLAAGEKGVCIQAGNEFYALTTDAAMLGSPELVEAMLPDTGSSPATVACEDGVVCLTDSVPLTTFYAFKPCIPVDSVGYHSLCFNATELLDCLGICEYICMMCDPCPPPPCGTCDYTWEQVLGEGEKWVLYDDNCTGTCECVEPVGVGYLGQTISTDCGDPPPPPCGTCLYDWNDATGEWDFVSDSCTGDCVCEPPAFAGTIGDTNIASDCVPPPPCGTCLYDWNDATGEWDFVSDSCTGDCECEPPSFAGTIGDTNIASDCKPPTECPTQCTWVWGQQWQLVADLPFNQFACSPAGSDPQGCNCPDANEVLPDGTEQGEIAHTACESVVVVEPLASVNGVTAVSTKLGDTFARIHPELFTGCKCKQGVVAVMNRWTFGQVSAEKIDRVVRTMVAKNDSLIPTDLYVMINDFANGNTNTTG